MCIRDSLSPVFSGALGGGDNLATPELIQTTLAALKELFNFSWILFLPLVVVIWGSVTKKPIVLTLLGSAWLAMIIAMLFQDFSFIDIMHTYKDGFSTEMASASAADAKALNILNRGGLYNLIEGITSCFLIFAFIGTLDVINSIDTVLKNIMSKIRTRRQAVVAAISSTLLTNLTTSNQYATSFIIAEAFKKKFNKLRIDRKVLSRSIEDAGTMMENLAPWTPSGIFMAKTLGISALSYGSVQYLSLINIVIAYFFAITGIACFYNKTKHGEEKT